MPTRGIVLSTRAARGLCGVVLLLALVILPGCSDDWDQNTPEGTIRTARMLVEKKRARELHKLIYQESPEMTEFLRKVGVLLGNLQKLAVQVEKSLPDDVAELRAKAAAAATETKDGAKAASLLGQLTSQRRRRGGGPDFKAQEAQQEAFQGLVGTLFADPYQILRENEARLTTAYLTDDSVSLRWDDEPILAPIGLQMKRDELTGLWYFKLPTSIPGLANYLPKSKKEWRIAEYAIVVVNNTIVDLRKDLETGQITSLDRMGRSAFEKILPPGLMIFASYAKALEDRKKQ